MKCEREKKCNEIFFLPEVLDGNGIRFPPFRLERRTYDLVDENEALGIL